MRNRVKTVYIASITTIVMCLIMIYPTIYQEICKSRTINNAFLDNEDNILDSIVRIVTVETQDNQTGYSQGASGIIFDKKDGKYYCLTAYHVVSDKGESNYSWLIQTNNIPTRREYQEKKGSHVSNEEYYAQFYKLTIEYFDEKHDLAIVSFESEEDLPMLEIASENACKGTEILLLRAKDDEEINGYVGYIKSEDYMDFDAYDGRLANKVIKHSAYTTPGSSGGAIINNESEIIGINIGGATDFFGRYKYGVMISNEHIRQVIDAWERTKLTSKFLK